VNALRVFRCYCQHAIFAGDQASDLKLPSGVTGYGTRLPGARLLEQHDVRRLHALAVICHIAGERG
jgi:hypothetical protein